MPILVRFMICIVLVFNIAHHLSLINADEGQPRRPLHTFPTKHPGRLSNYSAYICYNNDGDLLLSQYTSTGTPAKHVFHVTNPRNGKAIATWSTLAKETRACLGPSAAFAGSSIIYIDKDLLYIRAGNAYQIADALPLLIKIPCHLQFGQAVQKAMAYSVCSH